MSSIPRRRSTSSTRIQLESAPSSEVSHTWKSVHENKAANLGKLSATYTGEYEDVKAINDLLEERNLDCYIHVDAASGGFVAPFVNPDLVWDFRLPRVISINTSGHKYGLVSICRAAIVVVVLILR